MLFGTVGQRFAASRDVLAGTGGCMAGAQKRRRGKQHEHGQGDREVFAHGNGPLICGRMVWLKFNSALPPVQLSQVSGDRHFSEWKDLVTRNM
jgi:hypothetical protein